MLGLSQSVAMRCFHALKRPVGVIDSGIGGLSVMKEVRRLLPTEDLLFFADSAHCPNGFKPPGIIRPRAFASSVFLLKKGAKILVVAGNTTLIAALDALRRRYDLPLIGVEPTSGEPGAVEPVVRLLCGDPGAVVGRV